MRIDKLTIENFKGFAKKEFTFHPEFNLIVGINGSGKTTSLDALSVAIGSWFLGIRGHDTRHILPTDIRLEATDFRGETRFENQFPVKVSVIGNAGGKKNLSWERSLDTAAGKTKFIKAKELKALATNADELVRKGEAMALPLISYYGTGRLWQQPRAESQVKDAAKLAKQKDLSRFEGYKNSVDPRLSTKNLVTWMARQSWIDYQQGTKSSTFRMVTQAMLGCIEDGQNLYFDPKRGEVIVVMTNHGAQPFFNLSDGQKTVLGIVGDIAQKAVKLNPHLGKKVLKDTTGVVLIDELDLHLHPRWQRRIIGDLKRTFPKIQFICTTHSPQLIGQAKPEEIILLDVVGEQTNHPPQSLGMDSNWVLRNIMGSDDRDPQIAKQMDDLFDDIDQADFNAAKPKLEQLRNTIGEHPELAEANALIQRYTRFTGNKKD